ncbi:MAG: BatD family protein [Lentisphaeria bacterium]|nr:BatD family protein [Lentisphaeria bacterium]
MAYYLLILLFTSSTLYAQKVIIEPRSLVSGERAQLKVITQNEKNPWVIETLPKVDGIKWLNSTPQVGSSVQSTHVNGKTTIVRQTTANYTFQVSKKGTIQIPDITLKKGSHKKTVSVSSIEVRGTGVSAEDIQMRVYYNGSKVPPKDIYLGEVLSIDVDLILKDSVPLDQRTFQENPAPDFDISEISVIKQRGNRGRMQEIRMYGLPTNLVPEGHQGIRYSIIVAPKETGPFKFRSAIEVPLRVGGTQQQTTRSPFFMQTQRRIVTERRVIEGPQLNIKPLPPLPTPNAISLSIVGEVNVHFTQSRSEVPVGEDYELEATISGQQIDWASMAAPELDWPGFEVYKPATKISTRNNRATLTWVIMPTKENAEIPTLSLATFSPKQDKWQLHEFTPKLKILPGTLPEPKVEAPTENIDEEPTTTNTSNDLNATEVSEIEVSKPEIQTSYLPGSMTLSWLLAMPLLYWLLLYIAPFIKDFTIMMQNQKYQNIIKKLRHIKEEQFEQKLHAELLPYLKKCMALSPGLTAKELAKEINKPQLAKLLQEYENARYSPQKEQLGERNKILDTLAKIVFTSILLVTPVAYSQEFNIDQHIDQESQVILLPDSIPAKKMKRLADQYLENGEAAKAYTILFKARQFAPRNEELNLRYREATAAAGGSYDIDKWTSKLSLDEWILLGLVSWTFIWLTKYLITIRFPYAKTMYLACIIISILILYPIIETATKRYDKRPIINEKVMLNSVQDNPIDGLAQLSPGTRIRIIKIEGKQAFIATQAFQGWIPMKNISYLD